MKKWVKVGLIRGALLYFLMTFIWPLIVGREITLNKILIAIPIWIFIGLVHGFYMRKNSKEEKN